MNDESKEAQLIGWAKMLDQGRINAKEYQEHKNLLIGGRRRHSRPRPRDDPSDTKRRTRCGYTATRVLKDPRRMGEVLPQRNRSSSRDPNQTPLIHQSLGGVLRRPHHRLPGYVGDHYRGRYLTNVRSNR